MKRSLALSLLLLSACGQPDESPETPSTAAAPPSVETVSVDTVPPSFPEGATLSAEAEGRPDETPRRVTLRWEAVPEDDDELVGYVVRVDDEVALQLDAPAQEAVLEDVSFASPRRFTLAAVDGAGNESEPLETRDALAPRLPSGESVMAERDGDAYVLRWPEAVDDGTVAAYVIERHGEELATLPASARTYRLPDGDLDGVTFALRDAADHARSEPVQIDTQAEAELLAERARIRAEALLLGALSQDSGALADVLAAGAVTGNAEDVMAEAGGGGLGVARGGSLRERGGGGSASSLGGLGGLRTRSTPSPGPRPRGRVSIGAPTPAGGAGTLDGSVVTRSLRARQRSFQACYERELRSAPSMSGAVAAEMTIAPTGTVSSARVTESSIGSQAVDDCVTRALRRLRYNPGPEGGPVSFTVRFTFAPAPSE